MNLYDYRFYGLTRCLMISMGLWPDQNPKYRKFLWIVVFTFHLQGIISQYLTFITHQYSTELLFDIIPFNIILYASILRYNTIYLNSTNVKLLLERVNYDCNAIMDVQEIEIIHKYASKARLYTVYSIFFFYSSIVAAIVFLLTPDILNFVKPLNESRLRSIPVPFEYFFDQQKYFYIIVLFGFTLLTLALTSFMACEMLFMMFIQHACSLFAIASYRIIHAFDNCKDVSVIHAKLSRVIKIHGRSLQLVELMNSYFALPYMFLAALAILSLAVNILHFLQAMKNNSLHDIFVFSIYNLSVLFFTFWLHYFGQYLSDHSESFFENTYSAQWYKAPLHAQKLLLFILQRSIKTCAFNLFHGLLVTSMEGFATIISLSVSYFTLLYSLQT